MSLIGDTLEEDLVVKRENEKLRTLYPFANESLLEDHELLFLNRQKNIRSIQINRNDIAVLRAHQEQDIGVGHNAMTPSLEDKAHTLNQPDIQSPLEVKKNSSSGQVPRIKL